MGFRSATDLTLRRTGRDLPHLRHAAVEVVATLSAKHARVGREVLSEREDPRPAAHRKPGTRDESEA